MRIYNHCTLLAGMMVVRRCKNLSAQQVMLTCWCSSCSWRTVEGTGTTVVFVQDASGDPSTLWGRPTGVRLRSWQASQAAAASRLRRLLSALSQPAAAQAAALGPAM